MREFSAPGSICSLSLDSVQPNQRRTEIFSYIQRVAALLPPRNGGAQNAPWPSRANTKRGLRTIQIYLFRMVQLSFSAQYQPPQHIINLSLIVVNATAVHRPGSYVCLGRSNDAHRSPVGRLYPRTGVQRLRLAWAVALDHSCLFHWIATAWPLTGNGVGSAVRNDIRVRLFLRPYIAEPITSPFRIGLESDPIETAPQGSGAGYPRVSSLLRH